MKAKGIILTLTLIVLCAAFAACNPATTDDPAASGSPSASPSASATVGASPSTLPVPDPTPMPTPVPGAPPDPNLGDNFADLAEQADLVIRGSYTKKLPELWNMLRYMDDPSQPDPDIFIGEEQYEFKITEIYKNDADEPLKVGDTATVNLPFNEQFDKSKPATPASAYMKVALNEDIVIFLTKNTDVPDVTIWYPDVQPYHFNVEGDKLFAQAYDEKIVDDWNKAVKTEDGIPVANLKEDLDVE